MVLRNDRGYRIGEDHHRSTIPNEVVHELRALHEHKGIRYRQLIEIFAQRDPPIVLRYSAVKKICNYESRVMNASEVVRDEENQKRAE